MAGGAQHKMRKKLSGGEQLDARDAASAAGARRHRVPNRCAPDDAHRDTKRERVDKTAASALSHWLEVC